MRCSYELTIPCNIFTAPRCKITTNPFTNGKETALSFHGNQRTAIGDSNKPDNRMYKFKVNDTSDTSVKRKNLDNGALSFVFEQGTHCHCLCSKEVNIFTTFIWTLWLISKQTNPT